MSKKKEDIKLMYVLGNSRSGSTILSMYLGLHPHINFVGEIKKFDRSFGERFCTCGMDADKCPFWGPFYEQHLDYFDKPLTSNNGLYRVFSTYKAIFGFTSQKSIDKEERLLHSLHQWGAKHTAGSEVLIDSSKSLKRFILLSQMEGVDLYPVMIDRDLRSNLGSFVKRGKGVFRSYARLKFNRNLIIKYLTKRDVNFLTVKYEDFTQNPDEVRNKILDYVGLPQDDFQEVPVRSTHQISGNRKTRRKFREHKIIKEQKEADPFSPFQKKLLRILGL